MEVERLAGERSAKRRLEVWSHCEVLTNSGKLNFDISVPFSSDQFNYILLRDDLDECRAKLVERMTPT
jgi:hypothetical protein